ncbi:MAG TPA: hypothetical protein VEL76_03070 [Gemmataceae bacterium]|nr:hypothetical protein [Gemmataceae bacterium]
MRRVLPWFGLLVIVGCGGGEGGVSSAEQKTILDSRKLNNTKTGAETLKLSQWDSEVVEIGGQQFKLVRVVATSVPDPGKPEVKSDWLYKLKDTEIAGIQANTAGDDWKKGVKDLKWTE